MATSTCWPGDYTATNSRESTATVGVTGSGAADCDDSYDGDSDCSLPTLGNIISQVKATRKANPIERQRSSLGGSRGAPIVLDCDGSDAELDAVSSTATLGATPTPPPDANNHHTPIPGANTQRRLAIGHHDFVDEIDRLINVKRDGGSSSQTENQQRQEPAELTQSVPPSRKRSVAPEESPVLDPKRSRGSRPSKRRAGEAKKMPTRSNPHRGNRPHAFPRHWWSKQWEVEDIGRIFVREDGSLSCELLWQPTTVSVSTLNGKLLKRAEELVRQNHGAATWDKWLETEK